MVKPRKGIGRQPAKPTADDFVAGGNDAELAPPTKEPAKEYNHRIRLDVDETLYMDLKMKALTSQTPMVQLIREILSEQVDT